MTQNKKVIDWTFDEEILAFDVYLKHGAVGRKHPAVVELSALLQRLPIHPMDSRPLTFRNTNGVGRKLGDIQTHAPGYEGRLTNGSALDRMMWARFGNNPQLVHKWAAKIRAGLDLATQPEGDEDEIEATHHEGKMTYRMHRTRERSAVLRRQKVEQVRKQLGVLACECCASRLSEVYGTVGDVVFECHHLRPLHESGETVSALADVALLCPNCHRVAHRIDPWPDLTALRLVIRGQLEAER